GVPRQYRAHRRMGLRGLSRGPRAQAVWSRGTEVLEQLCFGHNRSMTNNAPIAWLTVLTLLSFLGGAIMIGMSLFAFPETAGSTMGSRLTFAYVGGGMVGFSLLALLFTLAAAAIISAVGRLTES
ncbi:MAG: hypothetical protein J0H64_02345, partial [Actinobacteria bacterium]|nr:hypothetical protein [Actinomycetota bacterium]